MSLKTNILNAFGWFLAECKKKFAPISHTHSDYSLTSHNHSGVYQPAGSYATSNHNHNASYITYQNADYPGMGINGNFNTWIRTPETGLIPFKPGASSLGTDSYPFGSIYSNNILAKSLMRSSGEVQSTAANGFRVIYGNRGFFIRNDGGYSYFLLTNQGDPYGTFNNLRPLYINNANGQVRCDNGLAASILYEGGAALSNKYQGKGSYAAANHNHDKILYNGNMVAGWIVNSNGMFRPADVVSSGKLNIGTGDNYIKDLNYSGALNKRSDKRYKNPLGDASFQDVKPVLENLQIRKFTYKSDDYKILNYGVYAQDLRDIMIEHNLEHNSLLQISTTGDEYCSPVSDLTTPEELVTYGVDYSQMSPMLLLGWQNHNKRIEGLEKTVNELKKENEILKEKIMASA